MGWVGCQHVVWSAVRAVSASCMGGRAQRWAVSAASMWRGARPGAVSASCLVGRVQRGLCAASMRRGARPGAVSASCLGVAYSEGCKRPACAADSRQGVGSSPWSWSAAFGRLSTAKEVERSSLWAVCQLIPHFSEVAEAWAVERGLGGSESPKGRNDCLQRSRERPVSAVVSCVSLWVASRRTALSHVGCAAGGGTARALPPSLRPWSDSICAVRSDQ